MTITLLFVTWNVAAVRAASLLRAVLAEAIHRHALAIHIGTAQSIGAGALASYISVDIER